MPTLLSVHDFFDCASPILYPDAMRTGFQSSLVVLFPDLPLGMVFMLQGRADQILTSLLFSLGTFLDSVMQGQMATYNKPLNQVDRSTTTLIKRAI